MLEEILDFIHNYFVVEEHEGNYKIEDGVLELDFLQENQYFMISGSVFNDGLHQYPADDLQDESFKGVIRAMAVPSAVVALSVEIQDWVENNPTSAYTSESFGGYSYTRGSGQNGSVISWRDIFGSRLNKWRKII